MDIKVHPIITRPIQIDDWNLKCTVVEGRMCKAAFDSSIDGWPNHLSTRDGLVDQDAAGIGMYFDGEPRLRVAVNSLAKLKGRQSTAARRFGVIGFAETTPLRMVESKRIVLFENCMASGVLVSLMS